MSEGHPDQPLASQRLETGSQAHRVLLVEDDMATLYALTRLFQTQGWTVSTSRSIEMALAQLDSPPDWIVLDLGLADGNGEEVLRYVREKAIPCRVAVVSGLISPERLPHLKPLKPDALFEKPIPFDHLLKVCGVTVSRPSRSEPPDYPFCS